MKQCPNCQITYTDDSLQFCLQDGTPLVGIQNQYETKNLDPEPETLVIPKKVEPIRFDPPSAYQTNQNNQSAWQPVPEIKKSSTAKTVMLSVLGTVLLLGLGAVGAWFYFNRDNRQVAVNVNVNGARNTRPANSNVNSNQNQNTNLNANVANASPSQTPTAQPTLEPQQLKQVAEDVEDVVADWKNASENLDLGSHLAFYADSVDYYRGGKVGINTVRADKERAYALYDSIDINIKNLKITPDSSGEKATALFDKEWRFEGNDKFSSGEVQQQLTLSKIKGRWLITGEKDLKVYYTQN